jgi:hypothetical protein
MVIIDKDSAANILAYLGYFKHAVLFDILFPGCRQQCYNIHLVRKVCKDKVIEHRLFDQFHRENNQPSLEYPDGQEYYHYGGKLHRTEGPAVLSYEGTRAWYRHGRLYSYNDHHTVEYPDGTKLWCYYFDYCTNVKMTCYGDLHRVNGPAIETKNFKAWYYYSKLHREDGPAIIYKNGALEWYYRGKRHRKYKPAIVYPNGDCEWYNYGHLIKKNYNGKNKHCFSIDMI